MILFTANDLNDRLKELGYMAECPESLMSCVLQRGAANAIDCKTYADSLM